MSVARRSAVSNMTAYREPQIHFKIVCTALRIQVNHHTLPSMDRPRQLEHRPVGRLS